MVFMKIDAICVDSKKILMFSLFSGLTGDISLVNGKRASLGIDPTHFIYLCLSIFVLKYRDGWFLRGTTFFIYQELDSAKHESVDL